MKRNLGGIQNTEDTRDRLLGSYAPIGDAAAMPKTYATDVSRVKHLYQAGTPSCGAHAGAGLKEIQDQSDQAGEAALSPDYLWGKIKAVDPYGYNDGTNMRYIMQTLKESGVCAYELLPNRFPTTNYLYANPRITPEMDKDAQNHRIADGYAFHYQPTVLGIKYYTWKFQAIILLIRCDDGFFGTTTPTFTEKKYGHFVVAYGFDENGIKILDSTEENTDLSLKTIPNSAIEQGFVVEVGTALDLDAHTFTFFTDMHFGDSNNDVRELQKKLVKLGYSIPHAPTYYFGMETRAAVIKFQDDHGIKLTWAQRYLPWSAVVGPQTRTALNATLA